MEQLTMQVVTRPAVGFTVAQDADLLGDLWLYMRWCEAWELFVYHLTTNTKAAYLRDWDDLVSWRGGVDWRQPIAITKAHIEYLKSEGRSAEYISTSYLEIFKSMKSLPWTIYEEDINRWVHDMSNRTIIRGGKETGLSKATVARAVASISAFYKKVSDEDVRWPDGSRRPLTTYNPVRKHHRADIKNSDMKGEREIYPLSGNQVNELLDAIPVGTIVGKRDFAMFSFYLDTGRRNSEVRLMKWRQIHVEGSQVFYTWTGKHQDKSKREAMPPNVWAAIKYYLVAAGRFDSMQPDDYLFTADFDYFDRHNNVGAIYGQSTDTTGLIEYSGEIGNVLNRPLDSRYINSRLKKYAEAIGIDPNSVWVHLLRTTFASTHDEVGTKITDIQEYMNHKNASTTSGYIKKTKGNGKLPQNYRRVEEQYRLPEIMEKRGIAAA